MKTEITEMGWKETTVKNFVIKSFHKHFPDMVVGEWTKTNERIYRGKQKGMRVYCPCCKINWNNLSGKINSVMTDKGNKVVCDSCFDKLGGNL